MEHMNLSRVCTLFFGISLTLSNYLASQEAKPEEHPASARSGIHELLPYLKTNETTKIQHILSQHPELIHENFLGQPLLHLVIICNETEAAVEIIRTLITAGCDVNCLDHRRQTALYYATMYKREAVAQCLEELGGKINISESQENTATKTTPTSWRSWLFS